MVAVDTLFSRAKQKVRSALGVTSPGSGRSARWPKAVNGQAHEPTARRGRHSRHPMAQPGQSPDDDDVRFGDDIDEVLSRANPNPERIGCPPRETLVGLARRAQPLGDPAYEHLVKCSPCYREFRALQESLPSQSARRSSWSRGWMAVAACRDSGRGPRGNVVLQSQRAPAKPTNRHEPIADRRTAHRTRLAQVLGASKRAKR